MTEFNDPIELLKCAYEGYKQNRRLFLLSIIYFIAAWALVLTSELIAELSTRSGDMFYIWAWGFCTGCFAVAFMLTLRDAALAGKSVMRGDVNEA